MTKALMFTCLLASLFFSGRSLSQTEDPGSHNAIENNRVVGENSVFILPVEKAGLLRKVDLKKAKNRNRNFRQKVPPLDPSNQKSEQPNKHPILSQGEKGFIDGTPHEEVEQISPTQNQNQTSPHEDVEATVEVPSNSNTSIFIGADIITDTEGINPRNNFGVGLSFDDVLLGGSLSISQGLVQGLVIDESDDEFQLADTALSYSNSLKDIQFFTEHSLTNLYSFSLTLPISQFSRENDIITNALGSMQVSKGWFDNRFMTSLALTLGYQVSVFQSTATSDGLGGSPLPYLNYGMIHNGSYKFTAKDSLQYGLSYKETLYYDQDPTASESHRVIDLPDQTYSFRLAYSRSLWSTLKLGFGFVQGSQLIYPGIQDFVLYDVERSLWFLSLSYTYSL